MHYEFQLAFNFIEGLPVPMIEAMEFLTGIRDEPPAAWPHPEFDFLREGDRNRQLLFELAQYEPNCGNGICSFRHVFRYPHRDGDHYQHTLSFRCLWHDDDFYHVWWQVVPWLAKYSDANGCVGYYKEQYELHPTLIYFQEGQVFFRQVVESPISISGKHAWRPNKL